MKKFDMTPVTRRFHKVGFLFKKHSPEILVVGGVIGTVAAGVMACKATTKLSTITENAKKDIEAIHEVMENPGLVNEEYTVEDGKKDLTITYAHAAVDILKLYGPAIAVGTVSITAILAGHNILRKRNVAITAAATAIEQSFKDYRGRLIERFGEDLDRELKYNIKAKEIEEVVVNEDGTETTITKTIEVFDDPNSLDPFSRFFDEDCIGWNQNPEYSRIFLLQQQQWATDKLKSKGYLFINEVYEMLGLPLSAEGQMYGWIYDEKHPVGDNFVDFGLCNGHRASTRAFVNGYENVILLDFNHDGNIVDKLGWRRR